MSTITLIVVVTVALLTLLALAWVVWLLVEQVRELAAKVRRIQDRLGPHLEELSREAEIAGRELERIADAAEVDEPHGDLGPRAGDPYTGHSSDGRGNGRPAQQRGQDRGQHPGQDRGQHRGST